MVLLKHVVRFVIALFVLPKNIILYIYGYKNRGKSEVCDALFEKGYYLYNEIIPSDEVHQLIHTYENMLIKEYVTESGQSNGRIMMPHLKSDAINVHIDRCKPIASDYFAHKDIEVELTMFQKSKVETDLDNVPGGGYHVDDNKKNLKFFIYLSDVTEKQGPFVLSPNSQGLSWYKVVRWFGWEITLDRKYFYMDELPKGCDAPIRVLGEKGTLFCADTTIYHKADRVIDGERLVLVISFAEKRFDPYKYILKQKVGY